MSEKADQALALEALLEAVRFNDQGWVCVVTQDAETGEVLQQSWANAEALRKTLETGKAHYYSRSRRKLWLKGETSGHVQEVREIRVDCDGDTVLFRVAQRGAACHDGYYSCFFRKLGAKGLETDRGRVFDPKTVYGNSVPRSTDEHSKDMGNL